MLVQWPEKIKYVEITTIDCENELSFDTFFPSLLLPESPPCDLQTTFVSG